jgi:pyrimidine-nucleoside phosphorylase
MILRKRDGFALSKADIQNFVQGVASGTVPEEQIGALLMAIYFQGMSPEETITLTREMLHSGDVLGWEDASCSATRVADKHSTGGVGDKVSLPLAPALAACGLFVPMVSGRGLGHTGGTLDKLESIPGYQTRQPADKVRSIVERVGCLICGQTGQIAPADKKLYSIRDITGTVESIPLITASILSKKAAAGLSSLILDVKVGRGAFMTDIEGARALAQSLVSVGNGLGMRTGALLTDMNHPIGRTVGNALEVVESIQCLRGEGPDDLNELVIELGATLLALSGVEGSVDDGREKIAGVLRSGAALERFAEMVEATGGDASVIDDPVGRLPQASHQQTLEFDGTGYLAGIDALEIARVALELGAGRTRKEDDVDPAVGIEILVPQAAPLSPGCPMFRVHHQGDLSSEHITRLWDAVTVQNDAPERSSRILEAISSTALNG